MVTCQGILQVTSHDECGKVVYRPCSSCISSVQNLMETLSSPLNCEIRSQ